MTGKRDWVSATIDVARPRAEVWEAWADPEGLASWWVDAASGRATEGATVTWSFTDFGLDLPVRVREARPPEALVFVAVGADGAEQEVRISLDETDRGTRVRVDNGPFPPGPEGEAIQRGCASGWALSLATLRHRLEDAPDAPRGHVFVMRGGTFEPAAVVPFFETGAGLDRWLLRGAADGVERLAAGDAVRLELAWGEPLSGEVMVRTPDELMLSWTERGALLTLKCFTGPGGGIAVGLDLSAWPLAHEAAAALRREMEGALERLVAALG